VSPKAFKSHSATDLPFLATFRTDDDSHICPLSFPILP
jgi:hypothetical protein